MLKKLIVIPTLLVGVMSCAQAATVAPVVAAPAPVAAAPGVENPHHSRDSIFRACKIEADNKKLVGNERNAAIATCVKTTPR